MGRKGTPDGYVVDADYGSGTTRTKQALVVDTKVADTRADTRAGLRELDAMVEATPSLNRLRKDRERLTPRATTAELGDRRMERRLPDLTQARGPLSARQRNARSKTRRKTQESMPLVQLRAQRDLVTNDERWRSVNDQLSQAVGDVQALPDADQERVRRVDRSIQAYERANNRGHVVYVNVRMPYYINSSNLDGYVRNNFQPGDRLAFDRYTAGTHQLHETAKLVEDDGVATFEIQTRRGAYLGQSDKTDNTEHLLPRSMDFEVVGRARVPYTGPAGQHGSRMVIQLRDITPEI